MLFLTAAGSGDPTRCSVPFHLAANGAAASGHQAAVVLAGDATELVKPEVSATVRGIGVPALDELFQACRERGVQLWV